jgi:hypothetical protein
MIPSTVKYGRKKYWVLPFNPNSWLWMAATEKFKKEASESFASAQMDRMLARCLAKEESSFGPNYGRIGTARSSAPSPP